jgi:hypothetical protein
MIPSPPLAAGALITTPAVVLAELRPGILRPCCICKRSSVWHWLDERQYYHPLHNATHCIEHLFEEWYAMIAAGEVRSAMTRLTGAYARRAGTTRTAPVALGSRDLGSPYFRPGMTEGTPWTAVARLADSRELITPCAHNPAHARRVNLRWKALAHQGIAAYPGDAPATAGWIVDPIGQLIEKWDR